MLRLVPNVTFEKGDRIRVRLTENLSWLGLCEGELATVDAAVDIGPAGYWYVALDRNPYPSIRNIRCLRYDMMEKVV